MQYEVELKFSLETESRTLNELQSDIESLGAIEAELLHQADTYFAHPARNFAETDEAFRIRSVKETNCVTYKGPVVDPLAKTREEIEISFAEGSVAREQFSLLLHRLGFQPVRSVDKSRRTFHLTWQQRHLEIALDEVDGLGSFVEIEQLADEAERDAARDRILDLADKLKLTQPERRSYLCLLLEKEDAQ